MIICIKKEMIFKVFAFVLVVGLTLASFIAIGISSVAVTNRKLPVYSVEREDKAVALTFDAAWGADKTKDIMRILAEKGATGTFFLVGFWVDKYPEDVKAIDKAGLEIGNHSRNHLKMSALAEEDIMAELGYVNDKVRELTGKTPRVFRPPFGDYNDRLVDTVNSAGMLPIQWSVDTLDWKGTRPNEILNRVKSKVDSGAIILFHNNSDYVVQALPLVIDYLKAEGYTFKTVSELVYHENYTIDNNGRQARSLT